MPEADARSVDLFERLLGDSLGVLEEWRGRGDSNGGVLHGLLCTVVEYAVWRCDDAKAGVAFLLERSTAETLSRLLQINGDNLQRLQESPHAPMTVLDLVVGNEVHIALLLDDLAAARQAMDMSRAAAKLGRAQRDKFWTAYADELSAVLERRPFQVPPLKLSGFHRSLEPHLHLMAALSSGSNAADALRSVDEAFQKRQLDRRLTDWLGVDGDGNKPVRWDFRRTAILKAAAAS